MTRLATLVIMHHAVAEVLDNSVLKQLAHLYRLMSETRRALVKYWCVACLLHG